MCCYCVYRTWFLSSPYRVVSIQKNYFSSYWSSVFIFIYATCSCQPHFQQIKCILNFNKIDTITIILNELPTLFMMPQFYFIFSKIATQKSQINLGQLAVVAAGCWSTPLATSRVMRPSFFISIFLWRDKFWDDL